MQPPPLHDTPPTTPSGAPLLSEHEYSEMLREGYRALRTASPVGPSRSKYQGKVRRDHRAAERRRRRARAAQR